mgnify:CR=1 FL=1
MNLSLFIYVNSFFSIIYYNHDLENIIQLFQLQLQFVLWLADIETTDK